jgi:hypothetical protein
MVTDMILFVETAGKAGTTKCTGDDALIPAAGATMVTPAWAALSSRQIDTRFFARALIGGISPVMRAKRIKQED